MQRTSLTRKRYNWTDGLEVKQLAMDINQDEKMKDKVFEGYDLDLGVPLLSDSEIIDKPNDQEDITEGTVSDCHNASQPSVVPMAAALVEQAMQGRWMPVEVVQHRNFARAKQSFLLYHRLYPLRAVSIFVLLVLPCFEIPVWCQGQLPYPCGDPMKYQLSGLPYIERWQSLLVEGLCLAMLTCSVALQFYYMGSSFWNYSSATFKMVLLSALILSAAATAVGELEVFQLSMYLRVLVPIVFTRSLRVCFRMTIRIMHTFADIAMLLGLFVLLSAYLATLIFRDTISEYEDYRTALLNLFVLLTTANNPNVWAGAYTFDRRAFFFFFTYLVVGLFFLMNLVFTVIYSNYKAQMVNEVEKRTTARQQCLRAAFRILDVRQQNWIDGATMTALLHAMSSYSQIPDFRNNTHEVFLALDKRGDFRIWQDEFEGLCDVIAIEIERKSRKHRMPRSRVAELSRVITETRLISEPVHDLIFWILTLASVLVAFFGSQVVSSHIKNQLIVSEIVLVCVFMVDAFLKIFSEGWTSYWRKSLNQYDFLLTCSTTIIQTAAYFHLVEQHWVSILLLARGLRLFCFMRFVSRWNLMIQTIIHLIPATAPVVALQLIVCTLFSLAGVHLFGGKVYLGNRLLEDTDYATGQLYAFNYNDYGSAMVTSFNLCIVNNCLRFQNGES
ncbi:two pore calcium channel protein 1 isoform X3 [Physcomitrium patens]|uniref:Ion transport domain-containing protein n=1 Tax=Physcomitrium patens TaxID=3218 RepID=A0A7I4FLX4_PHYPA|nr:two pore calcium channel protein 1-like isoform X2 [Physcomitrium patens]|eukprot:XP_024370612.1 two pore calcium channel protein 1-like isoform X2 [Physcomitrella patens]